MITTTIIPLGDDYIIHVQAYSWTLMGFVPTVSRTHRYNKESHQRLSEASEKIEAGMRDAGVLP